jgi:glutamate synthase (NADPH/NADH) small chain
VTPKVSPPPRTCTPMRRDNSFLTIPRKLGPKRRVEDRVKDYRELQRLLPVGELREQAERCIDCGVPFCHGSGCPLGCLIHVENALLSAGRWREALEVLQERHGLPEITGRVCPAPCESACTLAVHDEPVTIRQLELAIIERGFQEGWMTPQPSAEPSGKRVAVIGSGPAGLAAAQRLNRSGHSVTVLEKADRIGGLLRYGIPEFKLEKHILDRRIRLMQAEGVEFLTEVEAGKDLSAHYLLKYYHAICLAGGAESPRPLDVPGSELSGVHLAMDFLSQQNRRCAGDSLNPAEEISAKGKVCVVLGGGDTGADCVGTARRQGAEEIYQFELLPKPPESRTGDMPWPTHPGIYRRGTSHEEGCIQRWNISTKRFTGSRGELTGLEATEIEWSQPDENGRRQMIERPGTEFEMPVDLVILALGFTGPTRSSLLEDLGVQLTETGAVRTDASYRTSVAGVFCAGDMHLGPSLVVRAIAAGQAAADSIHEVLCEH